MMQGGRLLATSPAGWPARRGAAMTQEEALLQAVIDSPDDDAPRLIYADWLEERGDPRCEFIRLQCALAKLPQDDPGREGLQTRERELLAEHRKEWLRPLRRLLDDCEFRRGFVEAGSADAQVFVRRAGDLFRATPLRRVKLRGAAPVMSHLAGCPQLARLTALQFWCDHLGAAELQALLPSPHLGGLRALELPSNCLGAAGVRALVDSPLAHRLTELDLRNNDLNAEAAR